MMRPEKAACGAALSFSAQNYGWGRKPRRERTGKLRPPPRARNHARESRAGAKCARPPAQRRARDTRETRVPRDGPPGGGGTDGSDWNETPREARYAATERQGAGDGMAIMTIHDSLQRSGGVGCLPSARWTCSPPPPRQRARSCWGACAIRVKPRSRRAGLPGGGGMDGPHRNGATRGGRYAGTEPRNVTRGMANMTSHDIFGSSAAGGGRPVPLAPCLPPFAEQGEQKGITAIGPAFDPVPPV